MRSSLQRLKDIDGDKIRSAGCQYFQSLMRCGLPISKIIPRELKCLTNLIRKEFHPRTVGATDHEKLKRRRKYEEKQREIWRKKRLRKVISSKVRRKKKIVQVGCCSSTLHLYAKTNIYTMETQYSIYHCW